MVFSLSGLTPVMAAMIDYVMKPFRRLDITTTEFAVLQAVMFFDPGTVKDPPKSSSRGTPTLGGPGGSPRLNYCIRFNHEKILDTDGLDSASQRNVAAEQKKLLTALFRYISQNYDPEDASERYAAILLRIPTIRVRQVVEKSIFLFRKLRRKRTNPSKLSTCSTCLGSR